MKKRLGRWLTTVVAGMVVCSTAYGMTVKAEEEHQKNAESKLNYLYVGEAQQEKGDEQNIVLSWGDNISDAENVLLVMENEIGEQSVLKPVKREGELFLYRDNFSEGVYHLEKVIVTTKVRQTELMADDLGIDAYFGVGKTVNESKKSDYIEMDSVETSNSETSTVDAAIVSIEENGEVYSKNDIADAFAVQNKARTAGRIADTKISDVVVVLDPGHDSTHAGAHQNGLKEEELTLKIAQYCKEELETYAGVTVYMTRTTEACPYPGTTSTNCNKQRVAYADSVDCDIYVSIHLNSSESASANGVEVYYPNANYNAAVGAEGKGVAEKVLNELVALGLANRGVKLNDDDGFFYPDGSVADDHTVINNNKLNGIPAILIEHAFLSNASDVNNFLRTEEQLRELGRADARGIAAYYQLGKDEGEELYSANVSIENVNTVSGTFDITISDIVSTRGIQSILVPVWSQSDQSDLVWYTAERQSNGTYKVHVDVAGHNCNYGVYQVHTYIVNRYGVYNGVSAMSVDLPKSKAKVGVV